MGCWAVFVGVHADTATTRRVGRAGRHPWLWMEGWGLKGTCPGRVEYSMQAAAYYTRHEPASAIAAIIRHERHHRHHGHYWHIRLYTCRSRSEINYTSIDRRAEQIEAGKTGPQRRVVDNLRRGQGPQCSNTLNIPLSLLSHKRNYSPIDKGINRHVLDPSKSQPREVFV
jgi:hypothetical protein